jgi:diacylglycerol kinase (ATP)
MKDTPMTRPKVAPPRHGPLHVLDAARYSLAGLRRLWGETAARLEFAAAGLVAIAFALHGAELWQWLVAAGLFALVLAVEALNTAVEELTDRLSPEWSCMARDAKDLGSLAVGLMLLVWSGFVLAVLIGVL